MKYTPVTTIENKGKNCNYSTERKKYDVIVIYLYLPKVSVG